VSVLRLLSRISSSVPARKFYNQNIWHLGFSFRLEMGISRMLSYKC